MLHLFSRTWDLSSVWLKTWAKFTPRTSDLLPKSALIQPDGRSLFKELDRPLDQWTFGRLLDRISSNLTWSNFSTQYTVPGYYPSNGWTCSGSVIRASGKKARWNWSTSPSFCARASRQNRTLVWEGKIYNLEQFKPQKRLVPALSSTSIFQTIYFTVYLLHIM